MRKISLKEVLLFGGSVIALASCGGGGGGNGVSDNGYYQLAVQASPIVITPSVDITSLSIPSDQWSANVILNSQSGAQATSGFITSASLCVEDNSLSYQCIPVSFSNPDFSVNGSDSTTFQTNFYKLGKIALSTNPLQNAVISTASSTIPAYLANLSNSYAISQTISYEPNIQLNNSNITPGSVIAVFNWTVPAQVSYTTITTSQTNSTTSTTSISGNYTVSGECVDNGSGSFATVGSFPIACSGSINYTNGIISNFNISASGVITASYTTTMTSNTQSQTIITSYSIDPTQFNNYVLSNPQKMMVSYISSFLNQNTSGSVVSAYIPSSTSINQNGVYIINSFNPIGVLVVEGQSKSTLYQCSSTIPCSYTNGLFTITLPTITSNSYSFFVVGTQNTEYSFNPSITVSNYSPVTAIPYTFTVNVTLNTGQTEQATYNGSIDIFAP